ncbi:hypothetical protein CEP52_010104 [Fusarium oligoseptatum]|uniref:Uncharacterized protein n=1 Tax=Fusarium oligoseptatum TaxID=2604345 RepID=A0A428TA18_9HYPO|nr:hypothetical protein CEP52_010104 [Fusarium oligoseptatum]
MNFRAEPVKAESTTKRKLLTPPRRRSCGRLCDHAPSSIPDMKPVAKTEKSFVASFRALEVVDLISDDEKNGVYNVNPNQFYQHINTRFDELETKVRLGRVDDYAN